MGFFDLIKKNKKNKPQAERTKIDNVSVEIKENDQIIHLSGDVNSNNAAVIESKMDEYLRQDLNLIIDCENLNYISSAGLRILLRIRKTFENLKIINVKSDVYEVFEMTGFTKIMHVDKAYKEFSIEGLEIIGRGANGTVYRYDDETVLKVYREQITLDSIIHERELAREALILGVPTAISYDVVKVGENYASVFELINAKSLINLVQENHDDINKVVDMSVELLKQIHDINVTDYNLPKMKEIALGWLDYLKDELEEKEIDKLYDLINDVPESSNLIHGDYHLKNIMYQDNEIIMIDMDTLSIGNPIFEFGQIYLSYKAFGELDHKKVEDYMEISFDEAQYILEETIKRYFGVENIDAYIDKFALLAYMKLLRRHIKRNEGTKEEREYLKNRIKELLTKIDSLI